MGLNTIVHKIAYDGVKNQITIQGRRAPSPKDVGALEVGLMDPKDLKVWNEKFGNIKAARSLWAALRLIQKYNVDYATQSEDADLGFVGHVYTISEPETGSKIVFLDRDKKGGADSVTVAMLDAAGKTFRLNIQIENGIPTFVNQALAYLNQSYPMHELQEEVVAQAPTMPNPSESSDSKGFVFDVNEVDLSDNNIAFAKQ